MSDIGSVWSTRDVFGSSVNASRSNLVARRMKRPGANRGMKLSRQPNLASMSETVAHAHRIVPTCFSAAEKSEPSLRACQYFAKSVAASTLLTCLIYLKTAFSYFKGILPGIKSLVTHV